MTDTNTNSSETAVAQQAQPAAVAKKDPAASVIDTMKEQWALVLPSCVSKERFARIALTCIRKNEKLAAALNTPQGKASLMSAFMRCAEIGIEPDGRRAHLIPYGNEVTLIIDYKGLVEIVQRTGAITSIHADKVCDNDVFTFDRGELKAHTIDYRQPRGNAYAYYCLVRFKDGTEKCEVMTKEEVESIRKRSKAGNSGPWVTDFDEMAKKTVFRRCSKWLPMPTEAKDAIEADDDMLEQPVKNVRTVTAMEVE